ncbi:MAG: hypothetical protein HKN34_06645 [Gammaproteobacteria bacterium]|nr:hypothetical protein [Gammaproteobacteria bacterium]
MSSNSGYRDRRFVKRHPDFFSPQDDRDEIDAQTQAYHRATGSTPFLIKASELAHD